VAVVLADGIGGRDPVSEEAAKGVDDGGKDWHRYLEGASVSAIVADPESLPR
jgi:hypothetical protein